MERERGPTSRLAFIVHAQHELVMTFVHTLPPWKGSAKPHFNCLIVRTFSHSPLIHFVLRCKSTKRPITRFLDTSGQSTWLLIGIDKYDILQFKNGYKSEIINGDEFKFWYSITRIGDSVLARRQRDGPTGRERVYIKRERRTHRLWSDGDFLSLPFAPFLSSLSLSTRCWPEQLTTLSFSEGQCGRARFPKLRPRFHLPPMKTQQIPKVSVQSWMYLQKRMPRQLLVVVF